MARIRTIKPEFWQHPVFSRMSDATRLGMLAMINMADDEGYFLADPALIRSFAWPFSESSVSVQGVLRECSCVGWIELKKHPTHGIIARIINFRKHQKINRPSPSKLSGYFNSLNNHGGLTEDSLPDQGSGNRDQGRDQGAKNLDPTHEDNIADQEIFEAAKPQPMPKPKISILDWMNMGHSRLAIRGEEKAIWQTLLDYWQLDATWEECWQDMYSTLEQSLSQPTHKIFAQSAMEWLQKNYHYTPRQLQEVSHG